MLIAWLYMSFSPSIWFKLNFLADIHAKVFTYPEIYLNIWLRTMWIAGLRPRSQMMNPYDFGGTLNFTLMPQFELNNNNFRNLSFSSSAIIRSTIQFVQCFGFKTCNTNDINMSLLLMFPLSLLVFNHELQFPVLINTCCISAAVMPHFPFISTVCLTESYLLASPLANLQLNCRRVHPCSVWTATDITGYIFIINHHTHLKMKYYFILIFCQSVSMVTNTKTDFSKLNRLKY